MAGAKQNIKIDNKRNYKKLYDKQLTLALVAIGGSI
jgi:hypothetical protein